jgi:hypothetical protein
MIKKALVIAVFLTIPATALTVYAIYWLRNYVRAMWGIEIGPVAYYAILSIGAALALWITAGRFLKEVSAEVEKNRSRSNK